MSELLVHPLFASGMLIVFASIIGLLIGSFLNVVVARVPEGRSIVSPPSTCPHCGRRLRAPELVPVVSFLALGRKCRGCSAPISWRYPGVELATAGLFALIAWHFGFELELPVFLYLGAIAVALTLIDLDHHRLPNAIVVPAYPVLLLAFTAIAAIDGDWWSLLRAVIAGAALFAFYLLAALIYPAGMGLGDVKLAGVVGIALGWVGWGALIVGAFSAFLVGAVVGVIVIVTKRGDRKTGIPFGPFMLLGAAIGVTVGEAVAGAYLGALGL